MAKIISIFNNKGGVGKSTICWNLGDALGSLGKKVLLVDFDPQCNLSIAMLGEETFVRSLPTQNAPYGKTIRSFLQRFLQNTGGEELFLHRGTHTSQNVDLVAGDFWLNVYADSLNLGSDLLSGTGLARYLVLQTIVEVAEKQAKKEYDFVLVDLPPSFGSLVRASFYCSDYYVVPCTSDNYSVYCVGLIGQMVPSFVRDWQSGLSRFKETNPHFTNFDKRGKPVFSGWIFNGFDTTRERRTRDELDAGVPEKSKKMIQADHTMHDRVAKAIADDLVSVIKSKISAYSPVANGLTQDFRIGDIEDANALIQNSLWLNVPIAKLSQHEQVVSLQDRRKWAKNQLDQVELLGNKFRETAAHIINVCV
jgi:chromosome partitioning protein